MARITSISKIHSDGRHNAFTDMEYWKGHYYVAFRNGNGHARPGPMEKQGRIFVTRSQDLQEWDVCAQVSTPGDDRDPALLDMGEELGLVFGSCLPRDPKRPLHEKGSPARTQTQVAFTADGIAWSSPQPAFGQDGWLWQVERHGEVYYGAAYDGTGRLVLARSMDGRDWRSVSTIPSEEFRSTEAGFWITEDGVMHLVDRAWENPDMALLARSSPPYTEWKLTELNYTVHCPVIRPVGDELWVAGKTITAQLPASVEVPPEPSAEKIASLARRDERLAKTPQDWHTMLWRLTGDRLEPILVFPSRGDCGYPGLVVEEDRVLMSYYSQHDVDEGPTSAPGECACEIYLAQIAL